MPLIECPVLYPTHSEVGGSFEAYISRVADRKLAQAGVVKIVAPAGWTPRRAGYAADTLRDVNIERPIRQHATGSKGMLRMLLMEQKPMSLAEFAEVANAPENQAPVTSQQAELDRKYWQNITLRPPLYGADVPGSLFDEDLEGWNLGRLDTLLSKVMGEAGHSLPGVTSPYLYFGTWRSTFAWHTEDMDLYSVNYLHYGAPKHWYCIPPEHRQRFENVAKGVLPDLFRNCPEFFRHKELMISPTLLNQYQIPFVKVIQVPGEFIVTYPGAYHAGFNSGYNCAESVNFGNLQWVPIGALANSCSCSSDTVFINMKMFRHLVPARTLPPELFEDTTSDESGASADEVDEDEALEDRRINSGWPASGRGGSSSELPSTSGGAGAYNAEQAVVRRKRRRHSDDEDDLDAGAKDPEALYETDDELPAVGSRRRRTSSAANPAKKRVRAPDMRRAGRAAAIAAAAAAFAADCAAKEAATPQTVLNELHLNKFVKRARLTLSEVVEAVLAAAQARIVVAVAARGTAAAVGQPAVTLAAPARTCHAPSATSVPITTTPSPRPNVEAPPLVNPTFAALGAPVMSRFLPAALPTTVFPQVILTPNGRATTASPVVPSSKRALPSFPASEEPIEAWRILAAQQQGISALRKGLLRQRPDLVLPIDDNEMPAALPARQSPPITRKAAGTHPSSTNAILPVHTSQVLPDSLEAVAADTEAEAGTKQAQSKPLPALPKVLTPEAMLAARTAAAAAAAASAVQPVQGFKIIAGVAVPVPTLAGPPAVLPARLLDVKADVTATAQPVRPAQRRKRPPAARPPSPPQQEAAAVEAHLLRLTPAARQGLHSCTALADAIAASAAAIFAVRNPLPDPAPPVPKARKPLHANSTNSNSNAAQPQKKLRTVSNADTSLQKTLPASSDLAPAPPDGHINVTAMLGAVVKPAYLGKPTLPARSLADIFKNRQSLRHPALGNMVMQPWVQKDGWNDTTRVSAAPPTEAPVMKKCIAGTPATTAPTEAVVAKKPAAKAAAPKQADNAAQQQAEGVVEPTQKSVGNKKASDSKRRKSATAAPVIAAGLAVKKVAVTRRVNTGTSAQGMPLPSPVSHAAADFSPKSTASQLAYAAPATGDAAMQEGVAYAEMSSPVVLSS